MPTYMYALFWISLVFFSLLVQCMRSLLVAITAHYILKMFPSLRTVCYQRLASSLRRTVSSQNDSVASIGRYWRRKEYNHNKREYGGWQSRGFVAMKFILHIWLCSRSCYSRCRRWFAAGAPLLGLSWLVTIKDALGIQPVRLDKDSLKEKVKQVLVKPVAC